MAKYCANCGKELTDEQDICLNCGVRVKKSTTSSDPNAKSKLAAGLFGIFLGAFGVHNFYLGCSTFNHCFILWYLKSCVRYLGTY